MRVEVIRHVVIRGRVQGVGYRAFAEYTAQGHGLGGWVRNGESGDVELIACGSPRQLDDLETWLWQGPSGARVSSVQRTPAAPQAFNGFEVRR